MDWSKTFLIINEEDPNHFHEGENLQTTTRDHKGRRAIRFQWIRIFKRRKKYQKKSQARKPFEFYKSFWSKRIVIKNDPLISKIYLGVLVCAMLFGSFSSLSISKS